MEAVSALQLAACRCGCGRPVPMAKKTSTRDGTVRGEPVRFLRGHGTPIKRVLDVACKCGMSIVATKSTRTTCDACRINRRRERDRAHQKRRRLASGHKVKYRAYILRTRYGLTPEAYAAIFSSQDNACAICKRDTPGWHRDWHVDHDHATGIVRGILCNPCNRMLGYAKDSVETLVSAAVYIGRLKPPGWMAPDIDGVLKKHGWEP